MKQYLYADGVENVSLAGGMVRLDMFHYDGKPVSGSQELPREVDQQLVMPLSAFMRAFESMQHFVKELEKNGVITRQKEKAQSQAPASPNFS